VISLGEVLGNQKLICGVFNVGQNRIFIIFLYINTILPYAISFKFVGQVSISPTFLYTKCACKMLMKLTPGVNFIKILCTSFMLVDPKSIKKIDNLSIFFMLLGSAHVKAVCRTLMKLTTGLLV